MSQLLIITFYKIKILAKDKGFLIVMVLVPLLFAFLVSGVQSYEKQNLIPVVIADEDNSDYSRLLIERLAGKEGIQLIVTDKTKAENLVKNYQAEVAFIIKRGFKEAILQENINESITLLKSPVSLSYGIIQEMLASEVMRLASNASAANWVTKIYKQFQLQMTGQPSDLWGSAWKYADSLWEPEPLMKMEYRELGSTGIIVPTHKTLPIISLQSLGMILMFLMFFIMFNSSWLIEERNNFTLQRLVIVPGLLPKYFLANILSLLVLALVQLGIFLSLTRLFFHIFLFTSFYHYIILILYILAVIALGLFLSVFLKTPAQLQAGAPAISLLTSFIGGCFWSFLDPPETIKIMSLFTPQGWALRMIKDLVLNNYVFTDLLRTCLALIVFTLFMLAAAYWKIRRAVLQ
ncbi:hypothetical protein BR63_17535 [Thermanaerosceptrum fracticalcis]|uniref:ABC transmembrane type-2 domain-containing protein n=1 Tax=Thermanaerosceptrum fracticalcis TaxID=1712410 RepID=A0A7G6E745_THEFR|nr:ABC transporter permease [Thermanaerosceptrum fracticalcis]QNB47899.1 hypothetical protein BR63_17535 [Thermanaerosceptrum fracticalcis]